MALLGYDMNGEPNNGEETMRVLMAELGHIRQQVERNGQNIEALNKQLAGNGGPGIVTRIYDLERRLHLMERHATIREECLERVEADVNRIKYMVAGVGAAIAIIQILIWLLPLLIP